MIVFTAIVSSASEYKLYKKKTDQTIRKTQIKIRDAIYEAVYNRAPENICELYESLVNRPIFHELPEKDFITLRSLFFQENVDSSIFYQCLDKESDYLIKVLLYLKEKKLSESEKIIYDLRHRLDVDPVFRYARELSIDAQYRSKDFYYSISGYEELPEYRKSGKMQLLSRITPLPCGKSIKDLQNEQPIYVFYQENDTMLLVDIQNRICDKKTFLKTYPIYQKILSLEPLTLSVVDSFYFPISKLISNSLGERYIKNSENEVRMGNIVVDMDGYITKSYYSNFAFKLQTIPQALNVKLLFNITLSLKDSMTQNLSMPEIKIVNPPQKIKIIDQGVETIYDYMFYMHPSIFGSKVLRKTEDGFILSFFVSQRPKILISPNIKLQNQRDTYSVRSFYSTYEIRSYPEAYYFIHLYFNDQFTLLKTEINPNKKEYKLY